MRVTIIEREPRPRHAPGETLHPGVEPLLERLGVAGKVLSAGFLRHEGQWVQWGRERQFVPFGRDERGPWRSFQVWRPSFDRILLDRACHLGARLIRPCRTSGVIVERGRVCGVRTDQGDMRARFVMDATGRRGLVSAELGLACRLHSETLHASYGYVHGDCPARDAAPLIQGVEDGWVWTARVRPRVYQWIRLSFGRRRESKDWLPPELARLKRVRGTRGADMTWRIADAPAGPGYFLLGDAAAVLDPASSHGVLKALMTGMLAGHLAKAVARRQIDESGAGEYYRTWLHEWFDSDAAELRKFYAKILSQRV
jgi:flavin-dependent dehydrogenase